MLVVVAVLFVAGKHKFKVYCNKQFTETYVECLEMKITGFVLTF
jgi:hypothetical protein